MKNLDLIRIVDLEVFAYHGVYPEEKEKGQYFYVTADLCLSLRRAGMTDSLENTLNYAAVCDFITKFMQENTFDLIETAAEQLAQALLLEFDMIEDMMLEVRKPNAPVSQNVVSLSVNIERGWHEAYIAFGSNLGDREKYIDDAIGMMDSLPQIKIEAVSSKIETKPYGNTDQPDFLNGVLKIKTLLQPEELIELLHQLEDHAGRKRDVHWGPRTLDLDLLLYDTDCGTSGKLNIPHPDMKNREFVLKPLMEIAPYELHPLYRKTIKDLYDELLAAKKDRK